MAIYSKLEPQPFYDGRGFFRSGIRRGQSRWFFSAPQYLRPQLGRLVVTQGLETGVIWRPIHSGDWNLGWEDLKAGTTDLKAFWSLLEMLATWWSQGSQTSYKMALDSEHECPSEQGRSCIPFYTWSRKPCKITSVAF